MSVPVSKPAGDAAAAAPNGGAAKAAATSMVVDAFSAKVAGAIKPVLDKAAPAFAVLSQVFAIVYPYIEMAFTYLAVVWEKLQPYHPQEFMPAIAGFVLVFFGGNFFTLAAAVEAYRMVGFDDTKTALIALHKSYKVALDASKKDDEVDDDGDGIPDVKQISSKELVQRKIGVVAKAIDPELVADAVTAINAGLMAVVATLKVKFAKCVTIGVTVGGIAHNVVSTNFEPVLLELTPGEYKKWVSPGVKYACKLFGVSIAWWLQMTISAFHSASRGAQLFARGSLAYAVRHKYLSPSAIDEKGKVFNFFIVGLGCLGFWWQFWNGFSLPFPVNILLLPVTFAEYGMRFLVFMLG